MPFLYTIQSKKIKNPKAIPALKMQLVIKINKNRNVDEKLITYYSKSNSMYSQKAFSRHCLVGSMSIEAAIAVPLLLFACVAFLSLISVVAEREKVQHILADTARKLAIEAGSDQENIDYGDSPIDAEIRMDNEWIHLKKEYSVELFQGLIPLPPVHLTCMASARAWTGGTQDEYGNRMEDSEGIVYITDYGRVYHENRMCSHIYLKVHMADREEALKYPPCEKCAEKEMWNSGTFYITEDGECYHTRISCSGLKRSVFSMNKEKAVEKGYVPCERCSKE